MFEIQTIENIKTNSRKKKRQEILKKRKFIHDYKITHPCVSCGEKDCRCLSFHHRKSNQKRFMLHSSSARHYNMESIINEIKKCDVLCLNCHAKIHNGKK